MVALSFALLIVIVPEFIGNKSFYRKMKFLWSVTKTGLAGHPWLPLQTSWVSKRSSLGLIIIAYSIPKGDVYTPKT